LTGYEIVNKFGCLRAAKIRDFMFWPEMPVRKLL